jgi:hypothetical protein
LGDLWPNAFDELYIGGEIEHRRMVNQQRATSLGSGRNDISATTLAFSCIAVISENTATRYLSGAAECC